MTSRLSGIFALIVFAAVGANCETPADELAARQATSEHQYVQARGIYKHLAAAYPDNADYLVWIGRLSGYMGDLDAALAAYGQALAVEPTNLDALVGKAYILLWMHRYDEASAIIARAQEMAPESIDVNLASARRYIYLRQYDHAMKSLARVLEVDPKNKEALDLKAVIYPPGSLKLELGGTADHLSGASPGGAGFIGAGWISSVYTIEGRFEQWRRFDRTASRGSVQFTHTFLRRWIASGSEAFGTRGDIIPRWDSSIALQRKLPAGWAVGAQYRDFIFDSVHVHLAGPQVEYYFERPIWIDASYSHGWVTGVPAAFHSDIQAPSNTERIRYHQRIGRLTVQAGFGHGAEFFAVTNIDRLGLYTTNTYLGGVDIPTSTRWTTHLGYALVHRSNSSNEQIVSLSMIFRGGHEQ